MEHFTGIQYIKIAAANEFGMDKLTWQERLNWFDHNVSQLPKLIDAAANKFLFTKAINAYQDAISGKPTGYIMSLDATASGLQLMACLSGCKKTAAAVNLIDNGKREDVLDDYYNERELERMKKDPEEDAEYRGRKVSLNKPTRGDVKKPLMTKFYNKSRQDSFTTEQEIAFNKVLGSSFSGAEDVLDILNDCWDSNALSHSWTTPDGHVAHVKVVEAVDTRIEVDELDHTTFTYRYSNNQPSTRHTSLCPNYIHSLDAWVAREMLRMAKKQGFQLAHIHDSFWASPNHMNNVRSNYKEILADLADSNALSTFIKDVTGSNEKLVKDSTDLSKYILNSEYSLS